jgi:hypothetical protein
MAKSPQELAAQFSRGNDSAESLGSQLAPGAVAIPFVTPLVIPFVTRQLTLTDGRTIHIATIAQIEQTIDELSGGVVPGGQLSRNTPLDGGIFSEPCEGYLRITSLKMGLKKKASAGLAENSPLNVLVCEKVNEDVTLRFEKPVAPVSTPVSTPVEPVIVEPAVELVSEPVAVETAQ